MEIAAEFAKTRYTLGVPISTLQAISHSLANMAITVQGGRNLARRAAWFLDNEPEARPELGLSAFVFMAEEAAKAATMAVHIQGAWVFRRRPLRPHIWYGPGDGHWPVVIRASPPAESPRSWPAARVRNRPREFRTGVGDGFLPSADFRRGPRVSGNGA